jgi:hypothetical protein
MESPQQDIRNGQMRESAENIIRTSLSAARSDQILVVFDAFGQEIAEAFLDAAPALGQRLLALYVPASIQEGTDDRTNWDGIAAVVRNSHALVTAVSDSQASTKFRAGLVGMAVEHGRRVVHMPGVDGETFVASVLGVDFLSLNEEAVRVAGKLTLARLARIETRSARTGLTHVLTMTLESRIGHSDGGIASPGKIINIPTGEAYIAPIESSANGSIVIDGSFPQADLSGTEVLLTFVDGCLNLEQSHFPPGGAVDHCKAQLVDAACRGGRVRVGELGIGLNPAVGSVAGRTILDEKVRGTAHIAVGANYVFGGDDHSPFHIDLVFYPASISLDGVTLSVDQRSRKNGGS